MDVLRQGTHNIERMERRAFLKKLGLGTGSLTLVPWLESCGKAEKPTEEIQKARIGLIGTGSRGQYHLVNLRNIPHAEVVALCDNYEVNLETAAAMYPKAKKYTDYEQLLADKDIDGVIIATPLYLHAPMTLAAMAAGKHVFCEKAMALTLEQCKQVYEAYTQSDRVLFYCMQRQYDEKYIQGVKMIHQGLIGEVVGLRCHWFRNADWRREVPAPGLERRINWRLYKEYSAGLMSELGCHQLEVCNWVKGMMPTEVAGMGDIVYWKDGREVYDSVSLTYRYSDGCKITYESLISNKFNGMEEQVLGKKGTVDLSRGVYYLEEDNLVPGMKRLMEDVKTNVLASIPAAGPSWRPELRSAYTPHSILENQVAITSGESMIGVLADGSDALLSDFCHACLTGEKSRKLVEEAYCATTLGLLGNQAMEERRLLTFPDEYKIPYMKF